VINGKKVVAVLPVYNAEKTLRATLSDLHDTVDYSILVDDCSSDSTAALARELHPEVFVHDANYSYRCNQQTCDREALAVGD
jgi:glycosyltransferase involved in cell wall biosynthesis